MIRVLMIGDIVGQAGCEYVRRRLPELREQYRADVVIANGENSAEGNGILPSGVKELQDSGVDVITGGNHVLRRRQIYETLDRQCGLIRPANYHKDAPGSGVYVYDGCRFQLCVINLQGLVYLQSIQNPFDCIDELLREIDTPNIIVDFHAEATAEKICMGYHLDGRVSVVAGTHTHVPTSDGRILPGGTGYITDLGMCGGLHSVLGVRQQDAIQRMRTALPTRFHNETEEIRMSGCCFHIDEGTGRCAHMESFVTI